MAEAFGANGANVAIGCRNLGKGRELAERIRKAGGTAEVFSMEVTDPAGLEKAAAEIEGKFGAIHVLINNAGVNVGPEDRKPIHEFSDEKVLDRRGGSGRNLPLLQDFYTVSDQGGRRKYYQYQLCWSDRSVPESVRVHGGKGRRYQFSKAMALELAPMGIRVNVIAPGSILFEGRRHCL